MKDIVYTSDMDAESNESLPKLDDVLMSRSSLEKSTTVLVDGERSQSNKNMDSLTPFTTKIADDLDLKEIVQNLSLEESENNVIE